MNENEITLSIKEKLSQIEQRENIRILYACGLRMDYAEAYCSTYRVYETCRGSFARGIKSIGR